MTNVPHKHEVRAEQVIEAARHLFASGVMSHSGHANLSARLDEGRFLLTTSGSVRDLRTDQLAVVGVDGRVLGGELAPENAEIVAMHSVIYKARPDVGGVIHTHSPAATAFALANHGLLVFGPDPLATARLVVAIEESAEAELGAAGIGGAVDFPAGALEAVRASMARVRS